MTGKTPQQIAAELTKEEWDVLRLVPLGLTNGEIGKKLGISEETVKTRLRKLRRRTSIVARGVRARGAFADFYIEHLLPIDVGGEPLNPQTPAFTEPGQKLADWREWAKAERYRLLGDDIIDARWLEVLLTYVDPKNLQKSDVQVAALLHSANGTPMSVNTFKAHRRRLSARLRDGKAMTQQWLVTVHKLAPLDTRPLPEANQETD